jgi:hypothetical protein
VKQIKKRKNERMKNQEEKKEKGGVLISYFLNEMVIQYRHEGFSLDGRLLRVQVAHDAVDNVAFGFILRISGEIQHFGELIWVRLRPEVEVELVLVVRVVKGACLVSAGRAAGFVDASGHQNTST